MVFEATASAAELIDAGVDEQDVFVETTSFDTIGNAFYSRTDHCSLAGWKRLLIITSEFHMARSKAIFDWVFGATPHEGFELTYLATPDAALTPDAAWSLGGWVKAAVMVETEDSLGNTEVARRFPFFGSGVTEYADQGSSFTPIVEVQVDVASSAVS